MSDVTRILSQIDQGDPQAAEQLLPLVYAELKKLASARLAKEKPNHTLSATSLVHEAYLRLVGPPASGSHPASGGRKPTEDPAFDGRGHFFSAAAEAMRRILVESARRKKQLKHGGEFEQIEFTTACLTSEGPSLDLLALDEALTRLADTSPAPAEVVKLRFFAGLTMPETAQALGISLSTAERHWVFAKSWLYTQLHP